MKRVQTFILILVWANLVIAQTRADSLLNRLHTPSDYVFVVAHRGDWRNAPENSVQAVARCIRMGVDIVEIDLRMTKDSILVLMHDRTIDRTTTGQGSVADYTLAELGQFQLKDALGTALTQSIPTFEEVMLLCRDKILVNVDKASGCMDEVREILRKTGTEKQVIYKGDKPYREVSEQYGNLLDEIIYMPVVKDGRNDLEAFVHDFLAHYKPVAFEVLYQTEVSPMFPQIRKMREEGCRIWVNALWPHMNAGHDDERGVYTPGEAWGWLIDNGATIIQTDRPKELIDYLKERGLRH